MKKEFIPYQQALELKELGFNEKCAAHYCVQAPTYGQAFRFFRDKYNLRYSIGKTNIAVCHIPINDYHTTQLLQDNATYEDAELAVIKYFTEIIKLN